MPQLDPPARARLANAQPKIEKIIAQIRTMLEAAAVEARHGACGMEVTVQDGAFDLLRLMPAYRLKL